MSDKINEEHIIHSDVRQIILSAFNMWDKTNKHLKSIATSLEKISNIVTEEHGNDLVKKKPRTIKGIRHKRKTPSTRNLESEKSI